MTLEARPGSLLRLLDRLLAAGLLGSYVPVAEPSPGSGGRPWAHRLLDTELAAVRANQRLGVGYLPIRAALSAALRDLAFRTAEEALAELISTGLVLVAPPPPAWAVAVLARGAGLELAWLSPLPPVPVLGR
jgi:hypothetical protein